MPKFIPCPDCKDHDKLPLIIDFVCNRCRNIQQIKVHTFYEKVCNKVFECYSCFFPKSSVDQVYVYNTSTPTQVKYLFSS